MMYLAFAYVFRSFFARGGVPWYIQCCDPRYWVCHPECPRLVYPLRPRLQVVVGGQIDVGCAIAVIRALHFLCGGQASFSGISTEEAI